jgi:hypothetical protein
MAETPDERVGQGRAHNVMTMTLWVTEGVGYSMVWRRVCISRLKKDLRSQKRQGGAISRSLVNVGKGREDLRAVGFVITYGTVGAVHRLCLLLREGWQQA